ncbi:MAG: hypothetical protein A3F17_03715 [Gammaproteobacteria bacterium RIFCSPHIGHO2_12_FULL_41_15]|nr:MAG: hypothetical protein A3F17_03715 [Gammaproteobacteria bacterium RIFCSPHIGHO2_12_FULL_41_15]
MKIAIAGAGLVGRLLAFELLKSGYTEITLYDKNSHQSCAMTAAGLLSPFCELEKTNELIKNVGQESLRLWPEIFSAMDAPVFFKKAGSLVTAHNKDNALLIRYLQRIRSRCLEIPFREVLPNTLESEINSENSWYYFKEEAHMDCQQLMTVLGRFLQHKIIWHEQQEVFSVRPHEIKLTQEVKHYDVIFDCRGMGASATFSTLRSVRGELLWLHAPLVNLTRPIRLIHPRYPIYIVPRPHHMYLIGASEIEAFDYSAISVRTTLELLSAAYSLHKGFIDARVIYTATNCRPTLPDNLPKIRYTDGLIAVNGLYRHGYLLAPSLVQDIVRYLKDGMKNVFYSECWENMND